MYCLRNAGASGPKAVHVAVVCGLNLKSVHCSDAHLNHSDAHLNHLVMGGGKVDPTCNTQSAIVFIVAVVAGTICIAAAKALFSCTARGSTGEIEPFRPPVFETFIMFFGMCFALPMYLGMEAVKRLRARGDAVAQAALDAEPKVTANMVLGLAVPAVFDLSSVLLLMAGLMYIPASVWMMLRGGCIVFVALMKQFVLDSPLSKQMWTGVAIISIAVVIVGSSPMFGSADSRRRLGEASSDDDEAPVSDGSSELFKGLLFTVGGTIMQSLQYAYEEKVMGGGAGCPPWLLIGMEGVYGALLTLLVVYPIAGLVPGPDHGVYEDFDNTMAKLQDNPNLVLLSALFCVTVFVLNSFSVLVTVMLSSVWHAILDIFRPCSIWATQIILYYLTDGTFGEPIVPIPFVVELCGFFVLIYGTAVYNGNAKLPFGDGPSEDLLMKNSLQSSPAMTRSPMLTQNESVVLQGQSSPYASKFKDTLKEPLTSKVTVKVQKK